MDSFEKSIIISNHDSKLPKTNKDRHQEEPQVCTVGLTGDFASIKQCRGDVMRTSVQVAKTPMSEPKEKWPPTLGLDCSDTRKPQKTLRIDNTNIKLLSWNCRSLTQSKVVEILKQKPKILMLQEIWKPTEDVLSLLDMSKELQQRGDGYGGYLLAWKDDVLRLNQGPYTLNEDSIISKALLADNRSVWIGSVYLSRASKKTLLETFSKVKEYVPEREWSRILLAGDWNIDILDQNNKLTQALKTITKQMGLKIHCSNETRGKKVIDFVVAGNDIKIERTLSVECHLSDHKMVLSETEIPKPLTSQKRKIPNRRAANFITLKSLENAKNSREFLNNVDGMMKNRKYNIMMELKPKKYDRSLLNTLLQLEEEDASFKKVIDDYWSNLNILNERLRYSAETQNIKEAFSFLKRVYKYNQYYKRDGSIVQKILMDDGSIETRPKEVDGILLEVMKKTQQVETEPFYNGKIPFPRLKEPSLNEMWEILDIMSTNKAIAFDGLSDIMFKGSQEEKMIVASKLKDIWSTPWEGNANEDNHFKTRLIPLNKVHPQTPKCTQFRPISISSPVIKILEGKVSQTKKLCYRETL